MWISRKHYDFLNAEIERLRIRERELLNVILPKEGYRPIEQPERAKTDAPAIPRRKETALQFARRKAKALQEQGRHILLDRRIIVGSRTGALIDLGDRDKQPDATAKSS